MLWSLPGMGCASEAQGSGCSGNARRYAGGGASLRHFLGGYTRCWDTAQTCPCNVASCTLAVQLPPPSIVAVGREWIQSVSEWFPPSPLHFTLWTSPVPGRNQVNVLLWKLNWCNWQLTANSFFVTHKPQLTRFIFSYSCACVCS